jgi:hypothetical protein
MAPDASENGLGMIGRRTFLFTLAAAPVAERALRLEAIAGPRLPHRLSVRGIDPAPFFELRTFATPGPSQEEFRRAGIDARWYRQGKSCVSYLIPFESLAERQHKWDAFDGTRFNVTHISIYRAA